MTDKPPEGPVASPSVDDEVDAMLALSDAIRTLRERGWTVEPPCRESEGSDAWRRPSSRHSDPPAQEKPIE